MPIHVLPRVRCPETLDPRLSPGRLVPALFAAAGLVTILESLPFMSAFDAVAMFGPPTLATTMLSHHVVTRNAQKAVLTLVGWALLHALAATVFSAVAGKDSLIFVFVVVVDVITLVLAAPMLIAGSLISRWRTLETSDGLILAAGIWFSAEQLLSCAITQYTWTFLVGIGIGLGATLIAGVRLGVRRRWYERVSRGEVFGYHVRPVTEHDHVDHLPLAFGARRRAAGREAFVVESIAREQTAYRGGPIGSPLAQLVPRQKTNARAA